MTVLRDERIESNSVRFLERALKKSGLHPKPVADPPAYDLRLCATILPPTAEKGRQ